MASPASARRSPRSTGSSASSSVQHVRASAAVPLGMTPAGSMQVGVLGSGSTSVQQHSLDAPSSGARCVCVDE
jgi:hypothetical protein